MQKQSLETKNTKFLSGLLAPTAAPVLAGPFSTSSNQWDLDNKHQKVHSHKVYNEYSSDIPTSREEGTRLMTAKPHISTIRSSQMNTSIPISTIKPISTKIEGQNPSCQNSLISQSMKSRFSSQLVNGKHAESCTKPFKEAGIQDTKSKALPLPVISLTQSKSIFSQEKIHSSSNLSFHSINPICTSTTGSKVAPIPCSIPHENDLEELSFELEEALQKPFDKISKHYTYSKGAPQHQSTVSISIVPSLSKPVNGVAPISTTSCPKSDQLISTNNCYTPQTCSTSDNKSIRAVSSLDLKVHHKKNITYDKKNKVSLDCLSHKYEYELRLLKHILFEQQSYYQKEIDRLKSESIKANSKISRLLSSHPDRISDNDKCEFDLIKDTQVKQSSILVCDTINFSQYFIDVSKSYYEMMLTCQKRLEHQFSTIKRLTLQSDMLTKKLEIQAITMNDKIKALDWLETFGSALDSEISTQQNHINKLAQSQKGRNQLATFEKDVRSGRVRTGTLQNELFDLKNKIDYCSNTALAKWASDIELMSLASGCRHICSEKKRYHPFTSNSQTTVKVSADPKIESEFAKRDSFAKISCKPFELLISNEPISVPSHSQLSPPVMKVHILEGAKNSSYLEKNVAMKVPCEDSTEPNEASNGNEKSYSEFVNCQCNHSFTNSANKNDLKLISNAGISPETDIKEVEELATKVGVIFESLKVTLNTLNFLQEAKRIEIKKLKENHRKEMAIQQKEKNMSIFNLEKRIKLARRNLTYYQNENQKLRENNSEQ